MVKKTVTLASLTTSPLVVLGCFPTILKIMSTPEDLASNSSLRRLPVILYLLYFLTVAQVVFVNPVLYMCEILSLLSLDISVVLVMVEVRV